MENIFEDALLDDLFNVRTDGFECSYIKKYGKEKEKYFSKLEDDLIKTLNSVISDEDVIDDILEQFEDIKQAERSYWNRIYYKLGIVDGRKFETETKEIKMIKNELKE